MKPTPRALRDRIDEIPGLQPRLNAREQDRHEHIVTAGRTLLAEFGARSFSMAAFAQAMRLSPPPSAAISSIWTACSSTSSTATC